MTLTPPNPKIARKSFNYYLEDSMLVPEQIWVLHSTSDNHHGCRPWDASCWIEKPWEDIEAGIARDAILAEWDERIRRARANTQITMTLGS